MVKHVWLWLHSDNTSNLCIWDKDIEHRKDIFEEINNNGRKMRVGSYWNFEGVAWILKEEEQETAKETKIRGICWKIEVDMCCIFKYAQHVLDNEV